MQGHPKVAFSVDVLLGFGPSLDGSQSRPVNRYVRDFSETGRHLEHTPGSSSGPFLRACDVVLAGWFYMLDMPFSFAADTLTHPVTIPAALTRRDRPESPETAFKNAHSPTKSPILIPNIEAKAPTDAEESKGSPRD
jgi:hypothetical protein